MAARINPDDGVSDTALVRELCAAVADLGAVPSRGERLWAALRLVLERVIGAVVQFRGLVEHHGLWQVRGCLLLTQLYASRSITANRFLNALMGGLPHHSVHHAFPWIPAVRLPLASQRIAAVLERHGAQAIPQLSSYGQALTVLWRMTPEKPITTGG